MSKRFCCQCCEDTGGCCDFCICIVRRKTDNGESLCSLLNKKVTWDSVCDNFKCFRIKDKV